VGGARASDDAQPGRIDRANGAEDWDRLKMTRCSAARIVVKASVWNLTISRNIFGRAWTPLHAKRSAE
jgi:hypothetical protein